MSVRVRAAIAAIAALSALSAHGQYAGLQSNARVYEVAPGANDKPGPAGRPAIVQIQPQPAIVQIQQQPGVAQSQPQAAAVYVPSASDPRARSSTPIVSERVDEAARARAHAKYEAEKRRSGTASGVAAAGSTRLNEHPLMPVSRPSVVESRPSVVESRPSVAESRQSAPARAAIIAQAQTPEEAKSAEEARAAFLERAPGLSVHERTFAGAGERSAAGESTRPGASDAERARDILSELR